MQFIYMNVGKGWLVHKLEKERERDHFCKAFLPFLSLI